MLVTKVIIAVEKKTAYYEVITGDGECTRLSLDGPEPQMGDTLAVSNRLSPLLVSKGQDPEMDIPAYAG